MTRSKKKNWKKLLKFRRVNTDFSSHRIDWENFEQEKNSIALNVLFVSHNREEIKLAYKSSYNKRKNQIILLMINDEANNYYYFAIKILSELDSLGWLRGKKEAIINNNNNNNNLFKLFFKLVFICKQKNLHFSSTLTVILSIVGHITWDACISLYLFKNSGFSHYLLRMQNL